MRKSPLFDKGSINLLYANFQTVDQYDRKTQRELGFNDTPNSQKALKAKREMLKNISQLSQPKDEFDEMSLKEQIEVVMQPVINPNLSPDVLKKHLQDLESSRISARDMGRLTVNANTPEVGSKVIFDIDTPGELNSHTVSTRAIHESKYSLSQPPVKESDPFAQDQTVKHWHFHKPVKYNSTRNHSMSLSGLTDLTRKIDNKSALDHDKSVFSTAKNKSPPLTLRSYDSQPVKTQRFINLQLNSPKMSALKNAGLASMQPLSAKEGPGSQFNSQIASNPEAQTLLEQLNDPKIISPEGIIPSKRVNYLQEASREATFLLNNGPISGKVNPFGKNLLELNQARSQHKLTDSDKRSLNYVKDEEDNRVDEPIMQSVPVSPRLDRLDERRKEKKEIHFPIVEVRNVSHSPTKKKELYNKWYVPVKYWNTPKLDNRVGKKYEELKKDGNYYYHNLHNYNTQANVNPLQGNEKKSNQQLSFEAMQERLKQNVMIRKYKKQLAESHQRIPNCLKSIEENAKP